MYDSDILPSTGITFADAFLGQETGKFSVASDVDSMDFEGLTWLIEKKRPVTVTKFSGTMMHRTGQKDHQSQTVYAFAHFVYGFSNRTVVMADIQGKDTQLQPPVESDTRKTRYPCTS